MFARSLPRLAPWLFTAVVVFGCGSSDSTPATGGVGGSNGGAVGTAGVGGTTGVAGTAGVGGTTGVVGTTGVAGTTGGVAGTSGASGSAGGVGGANAGSGGASGGAGCTELVAMAFQAKADGSVQAAISPTLGAADPDFFLVELVDGATGTFDLGAMPDTNYKTCDHCLSVFEDANAMGTPARRYFQSKGSITVTVADPNLTGKSAGSVTDLTLVEVTLAGGGDFMSTPVPGGKCLHLAAAAWDTTK